MQKRLALDGGHKKKRESVAKRSKVGGSSVGAPYAVAKALASHATFIPLRVSMQSDQ